MQKRHFLTIALVALASCAIDETRPGKQLRGLIGTVSNARAVFLGYDANLLQEFRDSLTGHANQKRWYRIELPESAFPSPTETKRLDLGAAVGARLLFNLPFPDPMDPKTKHYRQLDVNGGGGRVTGTLELTGHGLVQSKLGLTDLNKSVGVALKCKITATVVLPNVTLRNHQASFTVGALAEHHHARDKSK